MASTEKVNKGHSRTLNVLRSVAHSERRPQNYGGSAPPPAYESSSINVTEDAKALRNSMGFFRTDKSTLIRILPLASLDPQRMAQLQETYIQLFNCSLEDDIRRYISSEFQYAMLGLIKGPIWLDVERLHDHTALAPITVQQIFTEIILYRPCSKLRAIQEMYDQMHRRPLVETIKFYCPGRTGRFLAMYLETARPEDGADALDTESIRHDVRYLHEGIWMNGKDMDRVSAIFARSSQERLLVIIDEFEARWLVSLKAFIKEKIDGDYQQVLLSLLSWTEDPIEYSRDALIKLWPVYKNRPARDTWTLTHTLIWGHFNRTLFKVGKMRLRYAGYDLRDELRRGLFDNSYQKLMLQICDGVYGG